jgi:mono/diheme cytochrome c family protein
MRAKSSITRRLLSGAPTGLLWALGWGGIAATALFATGCGTPGAVSSAPTAGWTAQSTAASPERAHIEAVYQSHCGSCHKPVAPGSEPSDRLQAELERHHKRTRLTEAEWAGLDAFLVARK